MKTPFILLLFISFFKSYSQNCTIKEENGRLVLKGPTGLSLDTIEINFTGNNYKTLNYKVSRDTVSIYYFSRNVTADKCPSYVISNENFIIKNNAFFRGKTNRLSIVNSGCNSYAQEASLYCILIKEVKIRENNIYIEMNDTRDRNKTLRSTLRIFNNGLETKKFYNTLKDFLAKPDCVSFEILHQ